MRRFACPLSAHTTPLPNGSHVLHTCKTSISKHPKDENIIRHCCTLTSGPGNLGVLVGILDSLREKVLELDNNFPHPLIIIIRCPFWAPSVCERPATQQLPPSSQSRPSSSRSGQPSSDQPAYPHNCMRSYISTPEHKAAQ